MQLIEVVPCGPLAAKYPTIKIAATTAAEAIEGWSRQANLEGKPVLEVLGFDTKNALEAPTSVKRIEVWPAMFGGGSVGKIVLGAALIAIAVWNPGIGGMILSQAGVGAVAGVGLGLVIGGVMQLFMKAPSLSKEEDPEASKYISAGRNTTAIGTIMGIGGGRMLIGGQYLSLQVNSSDLVSGSFPSTPA